MTVSVRRRGYVDTARGQLHYRRQGEGTPILMLQILPFSAAMFEPLMASLAASGCDCLALDLMGYGQSDKRAAPWTVEEHAEALDEALAGLSFQPACVVSGHFTAMVATEFALRHPDRLGRLVLDGVPLWPRDTAAERLANPPKPQVWSADGDEIRSLWASAVGLLKKFDPTMSLDERTTPLAAEAFFGFANTVLAPGSAAAIFRYDLGAKLPYLTTSTLVIGSPTDSLRDRHEEAMALIPGAREHVFTDTHPLYGLDRPETADAYAGVIRDFAGLG
jgi:pimeloyl-ACP methyl ester carboxylesterase